MTLISNLLGIGMWGNSHTKKVFKDSCERFGLVYFGAVDQQSDEHEMVRGVTLSPTHRDAHYCVGSVNGYDVILFERTDVVSFPGKPSREYRWNILQVDLREVSLSHTLLDANHHDETFYAQLFTKFIRLTKADQSLFADHDPAFTHKYTLYTPPDALDALPMLFTKDTTAIIGHHFAQFDFECFQDRLIVYAPDRKVSKQLVDNMVKAGIWLANELESNSKNSHNV